MFEQFLLAFIFDAVVKLSYDVYHVSCQLTNRVDGV